VSPQDFIFRVAPAAKAAALAYGIPASFTIAQAALESNWGESLLARAGFNLFGIKADSSWTGDVLELPTKEYVNGQPVATVARWRKYSDWLFSIKDHSNFLQHDRYKLAFKTDNVVDFVRSIAAAGYATDPQYADKIISLIANFHLDTFDRSGPVVQPAKEQPMAAAPTSSTNTAIVGGGLSAVTEGINWIANEKYKLGMPPGVMTMLATVILTLWHAFYNKKLAPPLPPPG